MGRVRGERHLQVRSDATFDTETAFKLRYQKRLSFREIGAQLGVHPSTVHKRLQRFQALLEDPASVEVYRASEADLIDSVKMRVLANIGDESRLAKAAPNHLAFTFGALFNAGRLVRDKSTGNICVHADIIRAAHKALAEEERAEGAARAVEGETEADAD